MSKIDKLGRVVIPINIRRYLKLDSNSEIDITMSNGSIVITPCEKICKLCGCEITRTAKIQLCNNCIGTIKEYSRIKSD